MSRGCARFVWLGLLVIGAFAASGCSSPTRVPDDARLIWSGKLRHGGHVWKDILPLQSGQMYVVDHSTGRVEGVETVWSGKPNFQFDLRPDRRYDLYFVEQVVPSTRPVE